MGDFASIMRLFSLEIRKILLSISMDYQKIQEIRLRCNKPLILLIDNHEYFAGKNGSLTENINDAYFVSNTQIRETMEYVSNYSIYAFEDELRQGFITVAGGHRIGVCGKAVIEDGKIKSIKYISFINMRLAHEFPGCSDYLSEYIFSDERNIYNTLIISPPRCGKTTLLRDIIRNISNSGLNVSVIDERSEIAAGYLGVPQNDLGIRTDVFDLAPKSEGIQMVIRSMAPDVVAIDEIGQQEDIQSVLYGMNCGCRFVATVHGNSIKELKNKPLFRRIIDEKLFERYFILNNFGKTANLEGVYDKNLNRII